VGEDGDAPGGLDQPDRVEARSTSRAYTPALFLFLLLSLPYGTGVPTSGLIPSPGSGRAGDA
ncbi:hypothetical protein, partial [Streptomyces sp. NPDC002559]